MFRSFLLVVVVVLAACDPNPQDSQLTCDKNPPAVTLAGEVQPQIIDVHCKSCHNTNDPSSGDYSTAAKTAAAVIGISSKYANGGTLQIVDPNNLANSIMWLKILGGDSVGRRGPKGERTFGAMPGTGVLTADEKQLVKNWICGGAN